MLATVKGVVKNGAIVPEERIEVPDGTRVQISFLLPDLSPEMQEEFAAWDRASDDAWSWIDRLEKTGE